MANALKKLVPAIGVAAGGSWAAITSFNDDWDDYTPSSGNSKPEKIVILGSGWAALNALRKCAAPSKEIVVVSPRPHFLYTPLLASSSVGTITLRSATEPLRALVERAAGRATSATFVRADARDIDVEGKRVLATTDSRGMQLELSYDKLIVAVGSQPNTFGIPGVAEHGMFMKEAEDSTRLHSRLLSNLEKAAALSVEGDKYAKEIDRLLTVFVVGGGPTGVELSAELADFAHSDVAKIYGADISERIKIVLVEVMPRLLGPFDASLAEVARDHLVSKGVEVRTGTAVTHVEARDVTCQPSLPRGATPEQKKEAEANSQTEEMGCLVWAAGIGARPLVKKLAQKLGQSDMRGLKVDEDLRVLGTDGVYAIGDCALSGFPPTAQVAAQQGKHVGRAIRDGSDSKFVYHHAGSLCCLGSSNGIAQMVVPGGSGANNVWDLLGAPAVGKDGEQRSVTGLPAFALWRSLYFTKLLSTSSKMSLGGDWINAHIWGRDIQEPVLKRTATSKLPVESFGTSLQRNNTIRLVSKAETMATDPAEKKRKRFWLF